MKILTPLLLLLAACSASHAYRRPAPVAFAGSTAETWDTQAAEDHHLHPKEGSACPDLPRLLQATGTAAAQAAGEPRAAGASATMAALADAMLTTTHGAPYGGPGRLTLVLRHYPGGREEANRAIFIVVPALRAGEAEREFRDAEIRADLHEPVLSVKARLETGRVLVRRGAGDLRAIELSLTLKPDGGDPVRVEARLETTVAR